MLLYATVCETFSTVLGDVENPYTIKKEVHAISNAVEGKIWFECVT